MCQTLYQLSHLPSNPLSPFIQDRVDSSISICYVAKDNLELLILLPPPPKGWNTDVQPPLLIYVLLEMEPRALCMLGKHYPLSYLQFFQTAESPNPAHRTPLTLKARLTDPVNQNLGSLFKAHCHPIIFHHCLSQQAKLHVPTLSPLCPLLQASTSGWP